MNTLPLGKLCLLPFGHFLWKTDKTAPNPSANTRMSILLPGTIVLLTKPSKFRYMQIIYEEMIGYIWCGTNLGLYQYFQALSQEDLENFNTLPQPSKKHTILR